MKNNIITIKVGCPEFVIENLRNALAVPEKLANNERLFEILVGDLIDRYLDVEYFDAEEIQDAVTEGRIKDRYLNVEESTELKEAFDSGMNPDVPSKQ